jgi:hypothetical protein
VWIAEKRPIELDRPDWLRTVTSNLDEGQRYVYFLRAKSIWAELLHHLSATLRKEVIVAHVRGILVNATARSFFFNPQFDLYIRDGNPAVLGVWEFAGPYSHSIDCGCVMEQNEAEEIYRSLAECVEMAQSRDATAIPGFDILEPDL